MTLELTNGQLLTLIEATHLATHLRGDRDTEEAERVLLRAARAAGLNDAVTESPEGLELGPVYSRALHDEISRYEDGVFWSALAEELAIRDLGFLKAEEEIDAMADKEYDEAIDGQAGRYAMEFASHGVDHLTLAHGLPLT